LFETIWAVAKPRVLISRSIRNTGTCAALALATAAALASAPALSRMIAAALRAMAVSISWLCLKASSSCENFRVW
jgi:hypothetical protein